MRQATLCKLLKATSTCCWQGDTTAADIMIVASADTASTINFLQCLAWDPHNQLFNYYMRKAQPGTDAASGDTAPMWVWAGNSTFAFKVGSKGMGVFDGHVSGSLVMKELRCCCCPYL